MRRRITVRMMAAASLILVAVALVLPAEAPAQVTTATTTSTPSISITPSSGVLGMLISVSGTNFNPGDTICVLSSTPSAMLQAPSCAMLQGSITASFTVAAGAAAGLYSVTVTSGPSGDTASATFAVLPQTQTAIMTPSGSAPSISILPSSGVVGTMISVSGINFNLTDTACALSSTPSMVLQAPACTALQGFVTASFTVAAGAATGSYYVIVTSSPSGDTAFTAFTVLPPIPTSTLTTTVASSTTTVSSTTSTTTQSTTRPRCVIATATFGSEVSPAVQFLRDFRDKLVLSTKAGSAFMEIFNAWYYSFSPSVAQFITNHDQVRAPLRAALYPLLGALGMSAFTYSVFSSAPEFAIVMSGLVASSLIGLVYLALPFILGMRILVKRRIRITHLAETSLLLLALGLALLAIGESLGSFLLLALASSVLVLLCIIAVPIIAAVALTRLSRQ